MDKKIELRKKRIINIVYFAIFLAIAFLIIKYCFWIIFPFVFAFVVAVIVQRPANFIERKTKLKKSFTTTVLTILLYALIACVVVFLGMQLVDAGKNAVMFVRDKISDMPTLIENVRKWAVSASAILPDSIEKKAVVSLDKWFGVIRDKSAAEIARTIVDNAQGGEKISISSISTPLSGIWSTAKQIPSVFVAVLITIISSCFMAADYDWIVTFIKNQFPKRYDEKFSKSKRIVFQSIGKLIRSYVIIIFITFSELFIGLNILKIAGIYEDGQVLIISLIIALLDILPVLGTGTFMVPWAIYSLITGKIGLGIGLIVVYAVITIVRQVIEPKIVGGTVGLPSFVTLMAMYIGSQLFGFLGIFILPISVIIIKLLNDEGIIHIWNTGKSDEEAEDLTE
ncbi:MAG: sporulation integral membrane protein YtvI [Clostridia bacterium]|nr:sporulation integral membrane protein YtvI [Clostridia bacterium]